MSEMPRMEHGGITAATVLELLALPNVACAGGTWLTPKAAAVNAGQTGLYHAANLRNTDAELAGLLVSAFNRSAWQNHAGRLE